MTRYKLILEYDGTNLIGWQENAQGSSVQSLVQDAIYKFCQQRVTVIAAGRTDAGVHSLGMTAHFDLSSPPVEGCPQRGRGGLANSEKGNKNNQIINNNSTSQNVLNHPAASPHHSTGRELTIMRALNFYLNNSPVSVLSCEEVSDDFHARFSCVRRNYRYVILNRSAPPTLDKNKVWHVARPLDINAMRVGSEKLIGNHDFTSFRASECQAKSPIKTLDEVRITNNESRITIEFSARSFLHHQVRNMVGTLVEIGLGKPLDIDEVFAAKNRSAAGPTAPASGLYFVSADYPPC